MTAIATGTFRVEADHPTLGLIAHLGVKTVTRIPYGIIVLIGATGGCRYLPPRTSVRLFPEDDCPDEIIPPPDGPQNDHIRDNLDNTRRWKARILLGSPDRTTEEGIFDPHGNFRRYQPERTTPFH